MKLHKLFLLFFLAFGLTLNNANVFAQDDDDDDDDDQQMEEMDEEEWQRQMDELNAEKTNLQSRLTALNSEIDGLKTSLAEKQNNAKICEAALYAAVGNTKEGVADYRKKNSKKQKRRSTVKLEHQLTLEKCTMMKYQKTKLSAYRNSATEWLP